MSITYTQQIRPWNLIQSANGNALSVQALADGVRSVNNLKAYASSWQLHDFANVSVTAGTDEVFLCQWGPIPWPDPFSAIRCEWQAKRVTANNTTGNVYSFYYPYTGASVVTASEWGGIPTGPITGTTTDGLFTNFNGLLTDPVVFDIREPSIYLVFTVSGGVASEDGMHLLTFDAWPEPLANV